MSDRGGLASHDAGSDAARRRVAEILESAAHVQLDVVVIAPPDEARIAARDRARAAAAAAGRGALLDEATAAARDQITRTYAAGGYSGTWAATDMAVSVARGTDRVAAAVALEEAVTAAVVEDVADPGTVEALSASWAGLSDLRAMPTPGSLSNFGGSVASLRGIRGAVVLGLVVLAIVASVGTGEMVIGLGLLAVALLIAGRAIAGARDADDDGPAPDG